MSKELPAVRVKVAFGFYRVGNVFRPPAMLRGMLLRRGVVELVDGPFPPIRDVAPVERAPTKPRRAKVA